MGYAQTTSNGSGTLDRRGNLATLPPVQTNGVDVFEQSPQCQSRQRWEADHREPNALLDVGQGDQRRVYQATETHHLASGLMFLAGLCLAMVLIGWGANELLRMFFG